jgi:hypothetical protein
VGVLSFVILLGFILKFSLEFTCFQFYNVIFPLKSGSSLLILVFIICSSEASLYLESTSDNGQAQYNSYINFYRSIIIKHPLSAKVGTNFADKRWSLGRYSSFTDSGHGVSLIFFSLVSSFLSFISFHLFHIHKSLYMI